MQSQHVFDPNERVSFALPARLVNVIFEVFRKMPGLPVPYDVTNELLLELGTQAQSQQPQPQPQFPLEEDVTHQQSAAQLEQVRARARVKNSSNQPDAG